MVPSPSAVSYANSDQTSLSLKESPQRWLLVVLMHFGMLFCYVHRGAMSVAVPFVIEDLHLSKTVMGVLLSAFFWPYAFLQTPAGWAIDRFGVKRVYAWGYVVWSLAAAATGLARGLLTLIAMRAVLGVGQSAIFPAHARATANWFHERERGTATAFANAGSRLGQSLVNGVGGLVIGVIGWQLFFGVSGLLPLIWLAPWLLFMRRHETAQVINENTTRPSFLASFALLKHRSVLGMCLGYACYNYCWILLYTWLPGYLKLERGFTNKEMAFFSSVPYLAGFIVAIATGTLADWLVRRGRNEQFMRKLFMMIGMAGAIIIVPAGLVTDKMTAVYLLSVAVCSLSISGIASWTLTQSVCDRPIVGTVGGLQNFFGNLGGLVAPALSGFIADRMGSFALALSVTGVLLTLGITAYWFMVNQRVVVEEAQQSV